MNDETFKHSIRKLLKTVGVQSQQQIEQAVQQALDEGRLQGNESLPAIVTLKVAGLDLDVEFMGDIELE
ncbi:DUF6494 family protein [Halomonas cerina]|uniref:HPt (Histidine-containing phosphotransfer) domain-containing protein n=1 Tax=Halomonas cerina TaxID=447424 RepID=A0A839V6G8_9GAMM|nr:DUF6494 family protein [Halomonas cerina]MBB3191022.1 HPt (histidine-containing phosphotransfer) domain-containing protein [Halomonas cerina]